MSLEVFYSFTSFVAEGISFSFREYPFVLCFTSTIFFSAIVGHMAALKDPLFFGFNFVLYPHLLELMKKSFFIQ